MAHFTCCYSNRICTLLLVSAAAHVSVHRAAAGLFIVSVTDVQNSFCEEFLCECVQEKRLVSSSLTEMFVSGWSELLPDRKSSSSVL